MVELLRSFVTSNFGQAILIAFVTGIATRLLTARGKLVWSVSHQHFYSVPRIDPNGAFPVRTQQIWIQNVGRASIEQLEIVLNWKPQHLEVWVPRKYEEAILPDERLVLQFPTLAGGESFTISMIDTFRELPIVCNARWKAGLGRHIAMGPQQLWPSAVRYLVLALLLIGITTILYIILQIVLTVLGVQ
jgi:hypothetical protein